MNCCGSLRPNARRSGEANEEDRHLQTTVGDRLLFVEEGNMFLILSEVITAVHVFDSGFRIRWNQPFGCAIDSSS